MYFSSMRQYSLFSFGISHKLVSHSVIGLVTSEPGHSSEEPAPWLALFPFPRSLAEGGSGVNWWYNVSNCGQATHAAPTQAPVPTEMVSEQSQSPRESRAQQSAEDYLVRSSLEMVLYFRFGEKRR